MNPKQTLRYAQWFILIAFFFSSTAYADTTTGLVGWWKLDEGSGTTTADSSGNGNTGTLQNSPAWIAGKIGGALSFNGSNSYVSAANSSSLNMTGSFTFSFWINPKSWNDGKSAGILSKKQGDPFNGYVIYDDGSNNCGGSCGPFMNLRVQGTSANQILLYSASSVTVGSWQQWAGVFDSTADTVTWYKNGAFDKSWTSINIGDTTNTQLLNIAHSQTWNGYFNGTIDDVRIYNRALTANDVAQLYNRTHLAHAVLRGAHIN